MEIEMGYKYTSLTYSTLTFTCIKFICFVEMNSMARRWRSFVLFFILLLLYVWKFALQVWNVCIVMLI